MNNCNVQIFDCKGNFLSKWGSQGEGDGQFLHPHSLELDSEGNVYVTDMANYNVQKFDSEGNFLLKWGEAASNGFSKYWPA
jgi:DNA-binding beta-propeller fold protein YncE